jgi:hypothetical protein
MISSGEENPMPTLPWGPATGAAVYAVFFTFVIFEVLRIDTHNRIAILRAPFVGEFLTSVVTFGVALAFTNRRRASGQGGSTPK